MSNRATLLVALVAVIWAGVAGYGIWEVGLDGRVLQAIIAGGFVAAGWIFNGWQNRARDGRLRRERLRDVHRALYAEIGTHVSNLGDAETLTDMGAKTVDRMRGQEGFVPFMARETHDRVFREIVADIHILPRVTIDPVVAYYAQLETVSAMVEDMRGEDFAALPADRRAVIYEDLIELLIQLLRYGGVALRLIEVFADKGKDAAEREALRLSSPKDADRSDPSQGSA